MTVPGTCEVLGGDPGAVVEADLRPNVIGKSGLAPMVIRWRRGGGRWMGISTRVLRAVLLAAAAAALAAAAFVLREKHQEAEQAVQDIHDQLDALDPATRAAVIARLTSEEVKKVRDHRK
jgi:hypothetical protein